MNDFSRATLRLLARNGIRIVGLQATPDMTSLMPYANASRGYVIDDNGTGRVWTFQQVREAA